MVKLSEIDIQSIEKKMEINRKRKWKVSNGVGQHLKEGGGVQNGNT